MYGEIFYLFFIYELCRNFSDYGQSCMASKPGNVYSFEMFLLEIITSRKDLMIAIFKKGLTIMVLPRCTKNSLLNENLKKDVMAGLCAIRQKYLSSFK